MKPDVKRAMFALREDLQTSVQTNSTVVVNRSDLELVVNQLFFGNDEWSNQSAFGYAIAAALSIRMSVDDIQALVNAMRRQFDEKTLESAAEVYLDSAY